MIREDRELLAELARLNRSMAAFCMRIMDGSANVAEQREYAERLIAAGEQLRRRAAVETASVVIDSEVLADSPLNLPVHTVEPYRSRE
jgi:Mg-chelatase subunit ChlD